MAEMPDKELMVRFQRGDIHAFELLFEKYRNPVFNFIYRMLEYGREPAEDLLQQIFIKLSKAGDYYEPRAKFSTWLFTIVRNHCLNYLKSRRYIDVKNTSSIDDGHSLDDMIAHCSKTGSFGELEQRETIETVEKAISLLPEKYREVFLLHAVEGFSHQETSRILGSNPATVRTHYHRARKMLREAIADILK